MRKSDRVWALSMASGALGAIAALTLAAPAAQADPELPVPPGPPPGPVLPGPEQPISVQAAAGDPALPAPPPAEVPHLFSPENLPPGTSAVPVEPPQSRGTVVSARPAARLSDAGNQREGRSPSVHATTAGRQRHADEWHANGTAGAAGNSATRRTGTRCTAGGRPACRWTAAGPCASRTGAAARTGACAGTDAVGQTEAASLNSSSRVVASRYS